MTTIKTLPLVDELSRRKTKRLFIKKIDDDSVSPFGIIIPSPQIRGYVVGKDDDSAFEDNEVVTIRRKKEYDTVIIDNQELIVIYEMEVVNAHLKIGAHTIIVKIDKSKRDALQEKTETGIYLPQIQGFQAMKYNLQYGEVISIGQESQKRYPELQVGDTAILHHTVESQDHRVTKIEKNESGAITYEYRIINTADNTNRDIFGKINLETGNILPFESFVFLEDNFNIVWHDDNNFRLSHYHDLESLNNRIKHLKDEYVIKAKAEMQMLKTNHKKLNPYINQHRDIGDSIDTAMIAAADSIVKVANALNRDFFLSCRIMAANSKIYDDCGLFTSERVIVGSKILYPIKLMGKKYLICTTKDLVAIDSE